MIHVGNRVRSHDASGKQGEITRYKWPGTYAWWDFMIKYKCELVKLKRVRSHDTAAKEGGIT